MTTDPRLAALAEALRVQGEQFLDQPESFETRESVAAAILAALPPSFVAAGLPADIEWEDVVDGLEVALSYPAEMEVNRERWRAARIAILDAWDREPKP